MHTPEENIEESVHWLDYTKESKWSLSIEHDGFKFITETNCDFINDIIKLKKGQHSKLLNDVTYVQKKFESYERILGQIKAECKVIINQLFVSVAIEAGVRNDLLSDRKHST